MTSMRPPRCARLLGPLAIVLALALAGSALAAASILEAIAGAYSANGGTIPACEFTSSELAAAEGQAGGAGQEYAADLLAAIQRALAAQASGACNKATPTTPTTTTTAPAVVAPPPSAPPPILKPPVPPKAGAPSLSPARVPVRSISSSSGAGLPAPLWILFVAVVLVAVCGAVAVAIRLVGWDPPALARGRHSWAEAGYRMSGAWADFADWARPSR
jgi:hypothetical protein